MTRNATRVPPPWTSKDLRDAGPLADVLIDIFEHYSGRPQVACAALAIVLGQAAQRFGVDVGAVQIVVGESARMALEESNGS